jgi:hypothetical protein
MDKPPVTPSVVPRATVTPKRTLVLRAFRGMAVMVVLTLGAAYVLARHPPPFGNPILYALAVSWLIAAVTGILGGVLFANLNPGLFSLARWERGGMLYARWDVRAFRWVLLHSPLGWINANLHINLRGRTELERLLREINGAEGAHWVMCLVSLAVAFRFFLTGREPYGYGMLWVNVPFNLYPIMLQRWNRGRVVSILRSRR